MSFLIVFLIIWTLSPGPVVALTLSRARQYGASAGVAVAGGATVSTALILAGAILIHLFGIPVVDAGNSTVTQMIGGTLIVIIGMHSGFKAYNSINNTEKTLLSSNQKKRCFMQGIMILSASIPQSIIFYAILIPQTLQSDAIMPMILGLGLFKVVLTFVWHSAVAIVADSAQNWFSNPRVNQRFDFVTAVFMVLFGINILV